MRVIEFELGPRRITIKGLVDNSAREASDIFVNAWNTTMDKMQDWLNQVQAVPTQLQATNQLTYYLNSVLNETSNYSKVTNGPCIGPIPSTKANYSCLSGF
jgi:hypothetical protein